MEMHAWSFLWTALSIFFGVVLWVAIVALIVALIRNRGRLPTRSSALEILEERYARGEMSRDEFIERRTVLRESNR